jgi:hypothetical protein
VRQFKLRNEDVTVTVSPHYTKQDMDGDVWVTLYTPELDMTLHLNPEDVSDLIRALIYESERRS